MTESVFLPAAMFALWMIARAITNPTPTRQGAALAAAGLATAVRLQGFVLVPTILIALALVVICARDPRLLRRFVPMVLVPVVGAVGVAALVAVGSSPLGAYDTAAHGGYTLRASIAWIGWHLVDVAVFACVFPLFAVAMLLVEIIRRRVTDPEIVALVSTTVAYLATSVALVGLFASQHVGQLAERDLISLAPPLFVVFSVWLARGMPRPQPIAIALGVALAALASFLPVRTVVTRASTPDALMLVPLLKLRESVSLGTFEVTWALIVVAVIGIALFVPSRAAAGLAVFVIVTLATVSILAQVVVVHRTAADRRVFFGASPPNWIDRLVPDATFLYANDPVWNRVWQTIFWNPRLSSVLTVSGQRDFGPVPGTDVTLLEDGTLVENDHRIAGGYFVTQASLGLVGTPIASVRSKIDLGLRLWRVPRPARVSYRVTDNIGNRRSNHCRSVQVRRRVVGD